MRTHQCAQLTSVCLLRLQLDAKYRVLDKLPVFPNCNCRVRFPPIGGHDSSSLRILCLITNYPL
jgi:hypothetical protein